MLDSVLAPVGVVPRAVHRVQLTEAIVYMVAAGWGVSALARWMVEPYLAPNRLAAVRIGRRGLLRQWRVAFRNADPRTADFSRLARALAQELKQIPTAGHRAAEMWADLLVASRSLRRAPIVAATASARLALGIGASSAMVSIVPAVLLAGSSGASGRSRACLARLSVKLSLTDCVPGVSKRHIQIRTLRPNVRPALQPSQRNSRFCEQDCRGTCRAQPLLISHSDLSRRFCRRRSS